MLPYGIASIILYVIGIPLMIFLLYRKRVQIIRKIPPKERTDWHRAILMVTVRRGA